MRHAIRLATLVAAVLLAPVRASFAQDAAPEAPAPEAPASADAAAVAEEPASEEPPTAAAPAAPAAQPPAEAPAAPSAAPAGARRRPLASPAPAPGPQIDWYRPQDLAETDPKLAWNRSIFGAFDPWTRQKVTFLFQYHAFDLSLPSAEGTNEVDLPGGSTGKVQYPAVAFSATYPGVRLEVGNWSLAFATAEGTLRPDVAAPTLAAGETRATTYEAIVARGFGATALLDGSAADVRFGISWPELYLRVLYGEFAPDGREEHFGILGAGVSIVGLRLTVADVLFAEVRAGDASVNLGVTYVPDPEDVVLRRRAQLSLRPCFRIGIAL